MPVCKTHCPAERGVVPETLAVVAAGVAVFGVVEFALAYAWILVPGLAAVAAATYGLYRLALAHTVQDAPWLARARAQAALPAAGAPAALSVPRLAIEPHRVIPGAVIHDEQEAAK